MTFKGAWTQSNRDMAFSLYDSWHRAHILRDQVSTEGLKNMINFKKGSGEKESPSSVNSTSPTGMAIPVVEFSREGYKIRKVFG